MRQLTAKDVMNTNIITVRDDLSIRDLAGFLLERDISGAPVVDADGMLVGVVSMNDITRAASEDVGSTDATHSDFYIRGWEYRIDRDEMNQFHIECEGTLVREIMTPTVFTIPEITPIEEIAKTMIASRVHRLFVTRGKAVVGIVTTLDMLKIIAGQELNEVPAV